jgi:hypothetical protein
MNKVLSYVGDGKDFLVDLVFSKEFVKGLVIGTGIMAVAVGAHILVRL